ncbi:MAG: hypothetical protein AABW51_01795 [Nanoarchaeota archaeon]
MKNKNDNTLIIVLVALFAFLLIGGFGYGMMGYEGYSGMMGGFYGGYGMNAFGWFFMILITVAIILLIFWLIKQIQKK